ncbi:UNVERIFIED_CONTAM: hypothetical protein FKN15_060180 [Acipenser sinensis]
MKRHYIAIQCLLSIVVKDSRDRDGTGGDVTQQQIQRVSSEAAIPKSDGTGGDVTQQQIQRVSSEAAIPKSDGTGGDVTQQQIQRVSSEAAIPESESEQAATITVPIYRTCVSDIPKQWKLHLYLLRYANIFTAHEIGKTVRHATRLVAADAIMLTYLETKGDLSEGSGVNET